MEFVIIFIGSLAVFVILLVLSTLHYFLGRTNDSKSSIVSIGTSIDGSTGVAQISTSQNRRKKPRKKNRRSARPQLPDHDEQQTIETKSDDEDDRSISPLNDDDDDYKDLIEFESPTTPIVTRVEDEQKPSIPVKSKTKGKNSIETPSKPQASVAPVKQTERISTKDSSNDRDDHQPLKTTKTHSSYSQLSERIRSENNGETSSTDQTKKTSKKSSKVSPTDSSSSSRVTKENQSESIETRETSLNNDYSSESDLISEPPTPHVRHSYPTKSSLKPIESRRNQIEELFRLLDTNSLTNDQLETLLNRVSNRTNILNEFFSSRKTDDIVQRLINEKNRNHLKTLAIELQSEKSRVLELSKSNVELEQMLRQLQHEQQTPNESILQCQQTMGSYQMQIKRLTEENNQLMHQLHAYSMIPNTIGEVKQQQQFVEEQIRQINLRNSILEKEIADGERASKNAADIYRKSDAQKQERIEQMISDLAKYRKIDKEIVVYRQKNEDLEKNFIEKFNEIRRERDQFEQRLIQMKSKSQNIEQEDEDDKTNVDQLEKDLNEAKKKHDLLKQRNCKIVEQLTKLTEERKSIEST